MPGRWFTALGTRGGQVPSSLASCRAANASVRPIAPHRCSRARQHIILRTRRIVDEPTVHVVHQRRLPGSNTMARTKGVAWFPGRLGDEAVRASPGMKGRVRQRHLSGRARPATARPDGQAGRAARRCRPATGLLHPLRDRRDRRSFSTRSPEVAGVEPCPPATGHVAFGGLKRAPSSPCAASVCSPAERTRSPAR